MKTVTISTEEHYKLLEAASQYYYILWTKHYDEAYHLKYKECRVRMKELGYAPNITP